LTVDLVTASLGIHAPICAGALVGISKLGGESKFGTEKVADLHTLRSKLLKATVGALELALNPILSTAAATESLEVDIDNNPKPTPARLTITGKEALTNAVRDFVKSDSQGLLDLRWAQRLDGRLLLCLDHLRTTVWLLFAVSGVTTLLMIAGKCDWIDVTPTWIHTTAFALVVSLFGVIGVIAFCILKTCTSVDRLKSDYADLS
jgi:hypothetical protein